MSNSLRNRLIEGIPEMEKTLRSLTNEELEKAVLASFEEVGTPTRTALLNYYSNKRGKHDGESLSRAMQHRWWSKRRRHGLPVGMSRVLAVRALARDGFGFKVSKLKRSAGFFLRIKAWGPGIHLIEKGRYKGVNTYRGWMAGLNMLRRFGSHAINSLNQTLPRQLELAAERAAKKSGGTK